MLVRNEVRLQFQQHLSISPTVDQQNGICARQAFWFEQGKHGVSSQQNWSSNKGQWLHQPKPMGSGYYFGEGLETSVTQ